MDEWLCDAVLIKTPEDFEYNTPLWTMAHGQRPRPRPSHQKRRNHRSRRARHRRDCPDRLDLDRVPRTLGLDRHRPLGDRPDRLVPGLHPVGHQDLQGLTIPGGLSPARRSANDGFRCALPIREYLPSLWSSVTRSPLSRSRPRIVGNRYPRRSAPPWNRLKL